MAYTDIPLAYIDRVGVGDDSPAVQVAAVAHVGHTVGHSFLNDGRVVISVRNTGVAGEVYVYIPATVDGQAVTMQTYTIDLTTCYFIGPFPTAIYNQGTDGDVHFGSDGAANITYKPWRLT